MPPDEYQPLPDPAESHSDAVRLPSLPQRLHVLERICSEAIRDPQVSRHRHRAQYTFFCGAEPAEMGGYDGQLEVVGRCLEWFVFDYVIPELEVTPAQHWLNTHAGVLSDQESADAYTCLDFILGLFEIDRVKLGQSFIALDLLLVPLSHLVREELITNEIEPGQLLLGRLFPHRDAYVLSGMAGLMDTHAAGQIKHLIAEEKLKPESILPTLDGVELENLFGRSVHEITEIKDLDDLHQRLRHYLDIVPETPVSFKQLRRFIEKSPDPLELAAEFCRQLQICCRHEMDLLFTIITTTWNLSHQS